MASILSTRNIFYRLLYIILQENDENKLLNDDLSKVDALVCAVGTDEDVVSWLFRE